MRAYDPHQWKNPVKLLPEMIPCHDTYDVAQGADALVIMTEWNQFRNLDFEKAQGHHAQTGAFGPAEYL
ncbi:MAG: UDP binding domain-containing protein [Nitrospiraceae bacterium]